MLYKTAAAKAKAGSRTQTPKKEGRSKTPKRKDEKAKTPGRSKTPNRKEKSKTPSKQSAAAAEEGNVESEETTKAENDTDTSSGAADGAISTKKRPLTPRKDTTVNETPGKKRGKKK